MRLLVWFVSHALSLAAAAYLVPGIAFVGPELGRPLWQEQAVPLLLVAVVLGMATSFVKPALVLLSFPLVVLSLGLFLVVINAALLRLTAEVAQRLDIGFTVADWTSAVLGALVVSLVTWLVDLLLG